MKQKIKSIILTTAFVCIISASGCAKPESAANNGDVKATAQATVQATVQIDEASKEQGSGTQTEKESGKTEFYKMKKSSDGASYEYSDDKYNISIKTEFQAQNSQQYKGEIDINGKKTDISEQYKACPSMTQIELAFADMNSDGKEDVVMRMSGYNCWAFATFVDMNGNYAKVEEPKDTHTITLNVLSGGKMEVSCADVNYKEIMDITPDFRQALAPGAGGIYDDKDNLVKELKISSKESSDTYSYELKEVNGKAALVINKIILYGNTSTGAAYTQYYTLEGNQFKLTDTKIYYSTKQTR